MEDVVKVGEFIARQNWIDAVTYRDRAPHEYILRDRVNGTDDEFREFCETIWKYGFHGEFWKQPRIYFYFQGYFYWTMSYDFGIIKLVNRCRAEDYNVYMTVRKSE